MAENSIVGTKLRPFYTYVTASLSKFVYTAVAVIFKRLSECIRFRSFSTFSSVLRDLGNHLFHLSLSRDPLEPFVPLKNT
jgi:hypothetical protein